MVHGIVFRDLPPVRPPLVRAERQMHPPGHWRSIAAELQRRPREWAVIDVSEERAPHSNMQRRFGPGFEFATRRRDDGRRDVYARYIGQEES